MSKYLSNKFYAALIAIFCCILWGSAFPVLKISYGELNMMPGDYNAKIVFAGMRFFIASLILFFVLIVFIKGSIRITKKQFGILAFLGLLQTALHYFFFYNGLANTSGMKGAILSSMGSFFVIILSHFIYEDDKMSFEKIFGITTGFLGIILINWGKGFSLDFKLTGEGFMILASLLGAIGTFIAKKLSKDIHPFVITAWQMFIGSTLLLSYGVPRLSENALTFTPKAWGLLIYAAFLSAAAFSLWFSLLKYNKAGVISLYKFVIPVAGTILSLIFLPGEKFSINILFALMLVSLGIISVNYKPKFLKRKEKKLEVESK